jgi:hypothetical protein
MLPATQLRSAGEKDVDDLRTLMEEVAVRSAETKKAMYEFKRDVIVGGEDTLTGVVIADRVMRWGVLLGVLQCWQGGEAHPAVWQPRVRTQVQAALPVSARTTPPLQPPLPPLPRFFEDKIYSKQVLLDKATLKNNTYKGAMAKLEAQLVHKEEMGEVLHAVDFDQLKIENQQHMTTIDTKNKELLALKVANGRTVQARTGTGRGCARVERPGALQASVPRCYAAAATAATAGSRRRALTQRLWPISRMRHQALNTIKAHLSSLERHNASLSSERVQLRQEHDRLTSAFASTQLEAAKVERKFMSLNANQSRCVSCRFRGWAGG